MIRTGDFAADPVPTDPERRLVALTLAIEAYKDDTAFRMGGAELRTGRIVAAAREFDVFLRGGRHTDD
jgi:hypothetical protein